jgi:hypothetical protein
MFCGQIPTQVSAFSRCWQPGIRRFWIWTGLYAARRPLVTYAGHGRKIYGAWEGHWPCTLCTRPRCEEQTTPSYVQLLPMSYFLVPTDLVGKWPGRHPGL